MTNDRDHHLHQPPYYFCEPKPIEQGELINVALYRLDKATSLAPNHQSSFVKVTHFNHLEAPRPKSYLGIGPFIVRS